MKLHIFSIYDSAVGAYMQPFFARSTGDAVRSFQDAVNDPKTSFNAHSSDYTLFYLGTFDDDSGTFGASVAERVTSALEMLMKPAN